MDQPGKTTTRGRICPGREQQALSVICATRQLIFSAVVPSWPSTPGLEKSLGKRRTFLYSATVTPFQTTQLTVLGLLGSTTFIQGIHTCSKTLLHICKQNLQPIYSRYTGKAP